MIIAIHNAQTFYDKGVTHLNNEYITYNSSKPGKYTIMCLLNGDSIRFKSKNKATQYMIKHATNINYMLTFDSKKEFKRHILLNELLDSTTNLFEQYNNTI